MVNYIYLATLDFGSLQINNLKLSSNCQRIIQIHHVLHLHVTEAYNEIGTNLYKNAVLPNVLQIGECVFDVGFDTYRNNKQICYITVFKTKCFAAVLGIARTDLAQIVCKYSK